MSNIRSALEEYQGQEVFAQVVEFTDKYVVHLALDGEKDTTIDIPLPSTPGIKLITETTAEKINPTVLLGNPQNLKTLVMATQIGTLFYTSAQDPKNVVLITSSKLWNEKTEASSEDFNKLAFVLGLLKQCLR